MPLFIFTTMVLGDIFDVTSIEAWGKLVALIGIPSVICIVAVLFGVKYFIRTQEAAIKRDSMLSEANLKRDAILQEAAAKREEQMTRRIRQLEDAYKTDYIDIIRTNQDLIRTHNELGLRMITTINDMHKSVTENSKLTQEVLTLIAAKRLYADPKE